MKRLIILWIACIFATSMLISCGSSSSISQSESQTTEGMENSSTVSKEEEAVKEFVPMEYEGDFFTWCDPEQRVYVSWQNVNKDIYPNFQEDIVQYFEILSLDYLNPEEMKIILPIKSDYYVEIYDHTSHVQKTKYQDTLELGPNTSSSFTADTYPYVLYHCYKGTDWKTMMELNLAAEEADDSQMDMILSGNSWLGEEYEALDSIVEAYARYHSQYREEYEALTAEDLPSFYYYRVIVYLGDKDGTYPRDFIATETLNKMELKVGEKSYTQEIGEIRVHKETYEEFLKIHQCERSLIDWEEFCTYEGSAVKTGIDSDGASYPYGDGIACINAFEFQTMIDITLTKSYVIEGTTNAELIGARIRTTDAKNKKMDFYWDLQSPVNIEAETNVLIDVFYKDANLGKLEYQTVFWFMLEYEQEGNVATRYQAVDYSRYERVAARSYLENYFYAEEIGDPWLRYAVLVDELDLQSYINDYYRPSGETWKWDLPW